MTWKPRRLIPIFGAALLAVAVLAPAAAHNLEVSPPGNGNAIGGEVGGSDIPGVGQGLIAGGPGGIFTLTPAHGKGLNNACEATDANPVVDIRGPGGSGCAHGE